MLSAFRTIGDKKIPQFYRETLAEIDDAVASLKDENGNYLGAGSTLVSVIIDGNNLYWGSVGDSHIYIIRQREMIRVNEEHNYFMELKVMVQRGMMTMEEALNDKNKDALISYMGIGALSLMEVIEKPFRLQKDDIIMLCSDGLYRSVSDSEMYQILLANSGDMQQAAESLVQCAESKGYRHQDNTTVITVRY